MNETAGKTRGRHEGAQPGSTREALLEAGSELFAELGFDGASVRAITARADANLGAITYHFGTKEAFYDAVIDRMVRGLADAIMAALDTAGPAIERVEAVVRAHFVHLATHPGIPRLLLQGVVASGMPPRAAMRHLRKVLEAMTGLIREGQADGTIRAGDPTLLALSLLSPSMHLAVMREPLRGMARVDLRRRATQERVTEHVVRFVRAAVAEPRGGRR